MGLNAYSIANKDIIYMQLSSKILIGMLLGIAVGLLLNMINDASAEPVPMISWLVENVFDLI